MRVMTAVLSIALGVSMLGMFIVLAIKSGQQVDTASGLSRSQQTSPQPENLLAGERQWYSYLDGNKIACFTDEDGQHRRFIIIPTPQQSADGEVMVANSHPSDDAWDSYCSKEPVITHF